VRSRAKEENVFLIVLSIAAVELENRADNYSSSEE
jgi:hypothetical protein